MIHRLADTGLLVELDDLAAVLRLDAAVRAAQDEGRGGFYSTAEPRGNTRASRRNASLKPRAAYSRLRSAVSPGVVLSAHSSTGPSTDERDRLPSDRASSRRSCR